MGENWRQEAVDRLRAAGHKADIDVPESILLAEARHLFKPGSAPDRLAQDLPDDIAEHADGVVSHATCAALARAAANLRGFNQLHGLTTAEALALLSGAAAKLEMKAGTDA